MSTIATTIPTKIKLGDTEFLISENPELKDLVQASQQIVKNQQYAAIEKLTKDNQALLAEVTELKAKTSATAQAQPTLPTTVQPQGDPNLKETVHAVMAEAFSNTLPKLLKDILDPINNRIQNIENETVEAYKQRRLNELGDAVVPEMVKGKTREDIDAAIEESKAVRARYSAPPTPPVQAPATAAPTATGNPVTIPVMPSHLTPDQNPASDTSAIKNASMDTFIKERDGWFAKIKQDVASAPTPVTAL